MEKKYIIAIRENFMFLYLQKGEKIKSILFRKYHIIRTLGQGSGGIVYLAEHISLQSFRAIKCVAKSNPLYQYTLNEAHILKNLKHPNIPIIFDIEEEEESLYIIEEYIEGESLQSYRTNYNHIEQSLMIDFSMQICQLIQYLHSQKHPILYLDLKPQNIIVSKDNILKLIDFGAAIDKNRKNGLLGTKGYAAPEQYTNHGVDSRADIYGIGALMFFMITGESISNKDYCMKDLSNINYYSKELKQIISRCLKYNTFQRYQSVSVLYNKLSEITQKNISVNYMKLKKSLTFSIAGSQRRMGTTHIALCMAAYLNKYIANCIYTEKNSNPVIKTIVNKYERIAIKKKNYSFHDCILNSSQTEEINETEHFKILIKDFGVLKEENQEEFLKGEVKILVLGAKEWELDYSENEIKKLEEYKDIYYLFNFVDSMLFKEVLNNMREVICYRMPYISDPFIVRKNETLEEMLYDMLQEKGVLHNKWKKRKFKGKGGL